MGDALAMPAMGWWRRIAAPIRESLSRLQIIVEKMERGEGGPVGIGMDMT